jgi:hypothetical protein
MPMLVSHVENCERSWKRPMFGSPRGLGVNSGPEGPRSAEICSAFSSELERPELRSS